MGMRCSLDTKLFHTCRSALMAILACVLLSVVISSAHAQTAPAASEEFAEWQAAFFQKISANAQIDPSWETLKSRMHLDPDIVASMSSQEQFEQPQRDYLLQQVSPARVERAIELLALHSDLLDDIEKAFRVDRRAIIVIWAMETRFGEHTPKYQVWSALSSMAYLNKRRRTFFEGELETLLLAWQQGKLLSETSTFDGGMGQPQFMPSALVNHAIDWDRDGHADIWNSVPDTLASIANYLRSRDWRYGEPAFEGAFSPPSGSEDTIGRPMKLSLLRMLGFKLSTHDQQVSTGTVRRLEPKAQEMMVTFKNFDVFRAYNGASRYAIAASVFYQTLGGATFSLENWPGPPGEIRAADIATLQMHLKRLGYLEGPNDGLYGIATWRSMNAFLQNAGHPVASYPTASILALANAAVLIQSPDAP